MGPGDGIDDIDHNCFNDAEYRERRKMISEVALSYSLTDLEIPKIDYTDQEKGTWKYCYPRLMELYKTNACEEYNWAIRDFERHVGYKADDIP